MGFTIINDVIRRTFRILPATGPSRERALWDEGIDDWSTFIGRPSIQGISDRRKAMCDSVLMDAEDLLSERDCRGLASMMPRSETWRLYSEFHPDTAFLDIETDGLGPDCEITVVGIHDRKGTRTLVSGQSLDEDSVQRSLAGASMLVTFNGSCFDIPVLRSSFPSLQLDIPHIDLRFAGRRAGLSGGLKSIERRLGLDRDEGIADVDGAEAVRLWNAWRHRGCERSLDTLLEYNRADTANLPFVAQRICSMLEGMTFGDHHG